MAEAISNGHRIMCHGHYRLLWGRGPGDQTDNCGSVSLESLKRNDHLKLIFPPFQFSLTSTRMLARVAGAGPSSPRLSRSPVAGARPWPERPPGMEVRPRPRSITGQSRNTRGPPPLMVTAPTRGSRAQKGSRSVIIESSLRLSMLYLYLMSISGGGGGCGWGGCPWPGHDPALQRQHRAY